MILFFLSSPEKYQALNMKKLLSFMNTQNSSLKSDVYKIPFYIIEALYYIEIYID